MAASCIQSRRRAHLGHGHPKSATGTYTYTFERGFDGTTAAAHAKDAVVTIVSNETLIQEALRDLGNANNLTDSKRSPSAAVDSQHYTIDFNDNNPATNLNVCQLAVTDAAWGTGFLPSAEVTAPPSRSRSRGSRFRRRIPR